MQTTNTLTNREFEDLKETFKEMESHLFEADSHIKCALRKLERMVNIGSLPESKVAYEKLQKIYSNYLKYTFAKSSPIDRLIKSLVEAEEKIEVTEESN